MTGEMNILPLPQTPPATVAPAGGQRRAAQAADADGGPDHRRSDRQGRSAVAQAGGSDVSTAAQGHPRQRPPDHGPGHQQPTVGPRHQPGGHPAFGGQPGDHRATSHCLQRRHPHPHRHGATAGRHPAARQSADLPGVAAGAWPTGGVSLDGEPAQHRAERQHPEHRQPAAIAHRHAAQRPGAGHADPEIRAR